MTTFHGSSLHDCSNHINFMSFYIAYILSIILLNILPNNTVKLYNNHKPNIFKVWKCFLMVPDIPKHRFSDLYSPVWGGCSLERKQGSRVKKGCSMWHQYFVMRRKKAQNLTMNRMPQHLEWKVTYAVASPFLFTHKKSTGEYKGKMKCAQKFNILKVLGWSADWSKDEDSIL